MKIKRFDIKILTNDCETNHPIRARLLVLSKMHRLIHFAKIQPTFAGMKIGKPYYRLYIARIRVVNGSDSK